MMKNFSTCKKFCSLLCCFFDHHIEAKKCIANQKYSDFSLYQGIDRYPSLGVFQCPFPSLLNKDVLKVSSGILRSAESKSRTRLALLLLLPLLLLSSEVGFQCCRILLRAHSTVIFISGLRASACKAHNSSATNLISSQSSKQILSSKE